MKVDFTVIYGMRTNICSIAVCRHNEILREQRMHYCRTRLYSLYIHPGQV